MAATDFWLVLLSGVAIGLMLSISLRWVGGKLLAGNTKKAGSDTGRTEKEVK
ncbi:MAG: hypothetical protein JSW16_07265 [Dehalococcoidales bacterium]|nr:MAG: hypothetical protein JSW16_07265 [Dehalococcoidales bacterium]